MRDIYESNDSLTTPANLGTLQGEKLVTGLIQTKTDRDFFAFNITETAGVGHQIQLNFNHNAGAGDLDLFLYQVGNRQPILQSTTATSTELIELAGLSAGSYTVEVAGYRGSTGNYSLSFQTPEVIHLSDSWEAIGGDAFDTAEILDVAKTRFRRSIETSGDPDYYKFDLQTPGLGSHFLSIQFEVSQGNLNLELYDANKRPVQLPAQQSTGVKGNIQIPLKGLSSGAYYAKVTGTDGATNDYTLTLDAPRSTPDAWTVMTYMTASNLEWFTPKNIEQMEVMVSQVPNSVNFSVLWDQSAAEFGSMGSRIRPLLQYPTPGEPAWGDVGQAFLRPDWEARKAYPKLGPRQAAIERDNTFLPDKNIRIASPFQRLGERFTGEAVSLQEYISWATGNAPATRNALVMWNHGNGVFGFNFDDSDGLPLSNMKTQTLVSVLKTAQRQGTQIDLLAFDACMMASAEVAYELRGLTKLLVASEAVIPGDGYNYQDAFAALQTNPEATSPTDLARSLIRSYNTKYRTENRDNTLSVTSTDKLGLLASAIRQFTNATRRATAQDWQLIRAAQTEATRFELDYLHDLGKFVRVLQRQDQLSNSIQSAARRTKAVLDQAVIAQTNASKARTTGLSIFLPNTQEQYRENLKEYKQQYSAFLQATGWDRFLKQFSVHVLQDSSTAPAVQTDEDESDNDGSEPFVNNDQFGKAARIAEEVPYDNLRVTPRISDWFTFETPRTPGTDQGMITVKLEKPKQSATVKLYGSGNGSEIVSKTGRGTVRVEYANTSATPYWVEVSSKANIIYELKVEPLASDRSNRLSANTQSILSRSLNQSKSSYPGQEIITLTPSKTQRVTLSSDQNRQKNSEKYTLGLYSLEDDRGGVRDFLTGQVLYPSDAGYTRAVMHSSKALQSSSSDLKHERLMTSGKFAYAPFVLLNSTVEQALANSEKSDLTTYFAYRGANSNEQIHLKPLGDRSWGFEANLSGSDRRFDDIRFRISG